MPTTKQTKQEFHRPFIGGSDARIIMGNDEKALVRLWQEKRGEIGSGRPLGRPDRPARPVSPKISTGTGTSATPAIGSAMSSASDPPDHPLDGRHPGRPGQGNRRGVRGQVHAAMVVLGGRRRPKSTWPSCSTTCWSPAPRSRCSPSSPAAANGSNSSIEADPIYQTILIAAEKLLAGGQDRRNPALFDCEPPKPRIEAVRVVDMNASNSWAEFAGLFRDTQGAHTDHERAKAELKTLMPEDAKCQSAFPLSDEF